MTFNQFIQIFPEEKLPISITEESASDYSLQNIAMPQKAIDEFLLEIDPDVDEMTEFVPGFRIAGLKDIHAIVYWKAGLLNYQYILATFEKSGKLIDSHVIAGTVSDGLSIIRTVARIDEDMTIYMVSGMAEGSDEDYDASQSTAREMELLPDGRMIELA
ncbi:MAG: hypothetical protein K9J37_05435 [Saprospiraceae bacterium]|nr:hypothetical protein [Saprospiraceae bacterium]MCF8249332.1 hypothetical protein [Saprospiraceae bacterium]MCF8279753.1 hypothetical protein [Bacteroidales bacterium]MCF8311391.1 hypothetical protein [Saprospiraceae bacterium]MCF8439951.1 hypothetical protein [Saprospiraceae bacterium]